MEVEALREKIRAAGVIGAGGAGFPTHMKLAPNINTVLVNASECEPLLYTDYTILKEHIGLVVSCAEEVAKALGAGQVLLCMKKHTASRLHISDGQGFGDFTQVKQLPDVYPMGDEVIMIYQALGRVVPPGQLPAKVGVVVINAETAYNIAHAVQDIPVTEKWVTIAGDIPAPKVVTVPVNSNVRDVLQAAGVAVPPSHVVLDGGPAMGNIIDPGTAKITKKTKSLLILPDDIPAVTFKTVRTERVLVRTPSACCQCFSCTEMCPRHLLGYPLQPHKTLRYMGMTEEAGLGDFSTASLCSGCGVCTLMACCQGIAPSISMTEMKKKVGKARLGYRSETPTVPSPERENRMIPIERFMSRIGVLRFNRVPVWAGALPVAQRSYDLLLSQHVGKPSVPLVQAGDLVTAGQMVAKADDGISASLHTPVSGRVTAVTEKAITVEKG